MILYCIYLIFSICKEKKKCNSEYFLLIINSKSFVFLYLSFQLLSVILESAILIEQNLLINYLKNTDNEIIGLKLNKLEFEK